MRWVAPLFLGLVLFALGRHYSGLAAGLFMGTVGVAAGLAVGKIVRGRVLRNAPAGPELLPGETPRLHGPVQLLQPQGPAREAWAYLSDQRLSLRPSDGGEGVDLKLSELEEIRPGKKSWRGGELGLVFAGKTWKLRVPDAARWAAALKA